jgi:transketolase
MRPAIRLAALQEQRSIYVFTHDSIGLGEDGPTHQPVEHLASLRAIPNLTVIRPGDANEARHAWIAALKREGPTALVLTRQAVPTLNRAELGAADGAERGAYVLAEANFGAPEVILIATGSEVSLAIEARSRLEAAGVATRVVSMPSWELFEEQERKYRDHVLPPAVKARVAIEAGSPMGWREWVGELGEIVGIDLFGASAPAPVNFEKYGFTPELVARKAQLALGRARAAAKAVGV